MFVRITIFGIELVGPLYYSHGRALSPVAENNVCSSLSTNNEHGRSATPTSLSSSSFLFSTSSFLIQDMPQQFGSGRTDIHRPQLPYAHANPYLSLSDYSFCVISTRCAESYSLLSGSQAGCQVSGHYARKCRDPRKNSVALSENFTIQSYCALGRSN